MTTHSNPLLGKYLIFSLFFIWLNSFNISAQEYDTNDLKELEKQGMIFYKTEEYEKSIATYNKLETTAKKLNNASLVCISNIMKGHIYCRNGKNKEALENYYNALDIIEKTGNVKNEIIVNSGLIIVLSRMNQNTKAKKIALRSLKAIPSTTYHNKENHVRFLTTLSDIYLDAEQYDSVLHYAKQGVEMSKSLKLDELYVDLLIKKGMVFYYQKEYNKSLEYLFEAKEILNNKQINNKSYPTIRANYFIANCYYQKQSYDKAISVLLNSINCFEESDKFKPPAIRSHLLLVNCYNQKADYKQAMLWNTKYTALNEYYLKDKDQTVDIIHQKETNKLEQEIIILEAKQTEERQAKNRIFWILLGTAIALIFSVFLYFRKQRSNKTMFHKLIQEIDTLEASKQNPIHKEELKKEITIDDQKVNEIIKGLEKLEMQEYFLRSDCNLRSMAKKLKTNATYLSKTINTHKEKNFTEYINDLRIEYVLNRLKDDKKFRSYAIQSIATEIGYKSSYSLVKHFKAKTGINPSYYIKSLDKQFEASEIEV
ncbi:helix-turn-helix domain-containing protein [Aquimarina sp. MMG015]|uniref:AraC family transcriptional regulator n=1 Tax=Aquimarina sp. MMG015 TaxID=2822689 RepID=UPI001B3A4BB7|nr:AraC family transcriptional regulator [Aquimarina sp. MMG015]MBQ4804241.1 helix-turn-helix domain-containing protein [Aquimarina sp. MMG015]